MPRSSYANQCSSDTCTNQMESSESGENPRIRTDFSTVLYRTTKQISSIVKFQRKPPHCRVFISSHTTTERHSIIQRSWCLHSFIPSIIFCRDCHGWMFSSFRYLLYVAQELGHKYKSYDEEWMNGARKAIGVVGRINMRNSFLNCTDLATFLECEGRILEWKQCSLM